MPRKTKRPTNPAPEPPLRLEWRSPAELAEHPSNWRRHPEAQLSALTDVIADVGWAGACLFNERTGRLIDGHARRKVALDQGTDKVPVLIGDWDEVAERKILATLDPLAAMAEADAGALKALLDGVQTSSRAVADMLTALAEASGVVPAMPEPGAGGDEFDPTPAASGPTRTKAGELWLIGKHRLLVGDCTVPANVARLVGGERAAICFTSPPYNAGEYKLTGNVQKQDKSSRYHGQDDDRSEGDYLDLLNNFTAAALPVCDVVAVNIQQIAGNKIAVIRWAANFAERFVDRAIWYKGPGNPAMARNVMDSRFEDIWLFSSEHHPTRAIGTADFRGTVQNVFECNGASKDNTVPGEHAATMPLALCEWALSSWSKPSVIVYDPFLGSGTTLIAAHRLGRVCYGCEIEPRYADVILKRAEAEGLTVERAEAAP